MLENDDNVYGALFDDEEEVDDVLNEDNGLIEDVDFLDSNEQIDNFV